jgi:hypothetical protein
VVGNGITPGKMEPNESGLALLAEGPKVFNQHFVMRLLPNGDLDTTFGKRGIAVYDRTYRNQDELPSSIAWDEKNRAVFVIAQRYQPGSKVFAAKQYLYAFRLDTRGQLFESFGTGGQMDLPLKTLDPNAAYINIHSVMAGDGGDILISGDYAVADLDDPSAYGFVMAIRSNGKSLRLINHEPFAIQNYHDHLSSAVQMGGAALLTKREEADTSVVDQYFASTGKKNENFPTPIINLVSKADRFEVTKGLRTLSDGSFQIIGVKKKPGKLADLVIIHFTKKGVVLSERVLSNAVGDFSLQRACRNAFLQL